MTPEDYRAKYLYLQKHIFYGLTNLNNGFDAPTISYFTESQFEIVLQRVKEVKVVGLYGIEPHIRDSGTGDIIYYGVDTFENYATYPQDPAWYMEAFAKYKNTGEELFYSASFYVPGNYLYFQDE